MNKNTISDGKGDHMKKFIEEFKSFALRGNVIDMSVGVIIGGAFTSIVTAVTDNLFTPYSIS